MQRHLDLEDLVWPVIKKMGYNFIGLEYAPTNKGAILRIYIDSEQGLNIDDCQKVSYQISQVLSVEDSKNNYTLEVSSPGIDRKLFSVEQCALQIGKTIKINLAYPIETQRNFKGVLQAVQGKQLYLNMEDGREMVFNFEDVDRAQVVPEW